MTTTLWALKEWAIAVDALLAGELILLIRKGGIHESASSFQVPSDRALLLPTYEHQSLAALREDYRARMQPTVSSVLPSPEAPIALPGWAKITHQLPIENSPEAIAALHPFHPWTDSWLAERLAWKPARPGYVLLLQGFQFIQPVTIPPHPTYRGCRSWVVLQSIDQPLPDSVSVMSPETYQERVAEIEHALAAIAPAN